MTTEHEPVEKLLRRLALPKLESEEHRRQLRGRILAKLEARRHPGGKWKTPALLLLGLLCIGGVAAEVARMVTQAVRVRFENRTPDGLYTFSVECSHTNDDGSLWTDLVSSSVSGPYTHQLNATEIEQLRRDFEEVAALRQRKARELIGVTDTSVNGKFSHRTFHYKYTLTGGRTRTIGEDDPDDDRSGASDETVVRPSHGAPEAPKRSLTQSDWAEIRKLHNTGKPLDRYFATVKGKPFKFKPVRYILSDGTEVIMAHGKLSSGNTNSLILSPQTTGSATNFPSVDESLWEMKMENLKRAPPVLIIRPTRFTGGSTMGNPAGPLIAHNLDFKSLVAFAYLFNRGGSAHPFNRQRIILPADAPDDQYDLMFTLPGHSSKPLQDAIAREFGVRARKEVRRTDVLLLKIKDPARLAAHVSKPGSKMDFKSEGRAMAWFAFPISSVADYVEAILGKPVVASSELPDRYDITLRRDEQSQESLPRALGEAGLELVPGQEPVEMLVVEKVAK